ncbi:hypothetical protein ACSQ67_016622 [Phaseolus vulgaris]
MESDAAKREDGVAGGVGLGYSNVVGKERVLERVDAFRESSGIMERQFVLSIGGVGLRIRVYDIIMCFAAHLEAVNQRNADFDHIYRNMLFTRSSNLLNTAAGMVPYLFLLCSLAFSTYLFWLLYSSGLPLVLSVTTDVSTIVHVLRGTNVSLMLTT